MFELSGLFVAISSIGVAWVTAHFALRQRQEEIKASARDDYEKYRNDRLRENDMLLLNPLREEIMLLEEFRDSVINHYVVKRNEEFHSDEEKIKMQIRLQQVSIKIYRYQNLKPLFAAYWSNPHSESFREKLFDAIENVLEEKREEHAELLNDLFKEVEPKPTAIGGGPFVKSALWIERKLRDVLGSR